MNTKLLCIASLSGSLGLASASVAQCEPGVTGTGRYEYDPGTELLPIALQAALAVIERCGSATIEWFGLELTGSLERGSSRASIDVGYNGMAVLDEALGTMGDLTDMGGVDVSIENCPPFRGERPLVGLKGSIDLYSFHIGSGYFRLEAEGELTACDSVVIESPIATIVEVPVRIEGCVLAAESFGDQPTTTAIGRLELSGFIAGESIGPFEVEVESISVIPEQRCINEVRIIRIPVNPGITEFDYQVRGAWFASAGAKGTGLFGTIAGSSTVLVDFPDSIEVGNFRGEGGAPLPEGVVIRSAITGMEYNAGEATCYADCDGDGQLDFFDFLCFQNQFVKGDLQADCDGSGTLDFFDFLCFQASFAAGCP